MNVPAPQEFGRHSIRLNGYDYSQAGGYFVTIVTQFRESFFGKICGEEMFYTAAGKMVILEWEALRERFPNIEMDIFQVMPNHVHGIIIMHNPETVGAGLACASTVGAGLVPALNARATTPVVPRTPAARRCETARIAPTIGEIVGAFKSITTHKYIQGVDEFAWPVFSKKLWQRNYYEHIIRGQADYERIAAYILDNPVNWNQDDENPLNPAGKGNAPRRDRNHRSGH